MDEKEIRTWAYDQARMLSHSLTVMGSPTDIEKDAIRIARFVETGSFDETPKAEDVAPKTW